MDWNDRRGLLLGLKMRTFAPEGEDGQAEAGGEGGEAAGGDGDGAGEEGDGGDQGGGSILDAAKPGDKAEPKDGEYVAPDFLPDHLRGASNDETLKKLHDAYKGARGKISKGQSGLEGDVPEKADGYTFTNNGKEGEPDKMFAELTSEASKPIVSLAQKAAHKVGLPDKAFDAFMREFVAGAGESGLPIGASDEDSQQISYEAEMEALTEMVGSSAEAGTIVNTVGAYGQKLIASGIMSKSDEGEFRVMVGTARGCELFYRILTSELGEKPIPRVDPADGAMTATEAYALHASALQMKDGAAKEEALERAQSAMQKTFGTENSGSIRTNVL